MIWWIAGTAYAVIGLAVALGVEVYLRATSWEVDEEGHCLAAVAGMFWIPFGIGWVVCQAVRGIGRLAQAIADRIPAWVDRVQEMREEARR